MRVSQGRLTKTLDLLPQIINDLAQTPVTAGLVKHGISGKGSGHGVGLSQWGSQGMALRGMNYQTILRHYFGQEVVIADYTLNQEIR